MTSKSELNGGSSTNLGKRKKNRLYVQDPIGYMNGDRYAPNFDGFVPYGHVWRSIPDRRLYPAVSDPSVCDYRFGFDGVIEPTSLPIYPPYERHMYPLPTPPFRAGPKKKVTSRRSAPTETTNTLKPEEPTQDCTSLPPVVDRLVTEASENGRRYSDPGVGPVSSDSEQSSGCGSVIAADERDGEIVYALVEQINCLKESNRKLFRELHETKMELSALRQQANSRRDRDYEPGMLADIVREMRDAAKVREDALLTKVRHLIDERNFSRAYITPAITPSARELEDLKIQLKIAVDEKDRTNTRLEEIEKQVQNLKLVTSRCPDCRNDDADVLETSPKSAVKNSPFSSLLDILSQVPKKIFGTGETFIQGVPVHEPEVESSDQIESADNIGNEESVLCDAALDATASSSTASGPISDGEGARQVFELEQEKIKLRRELQESMAGRKQAEEKSAKLEQCLNNIRKTTPRTTTTTTPSNTPTTYLATSPNAMATSNAFGGSISSISSSAAATDSMFPSSIHPDENNKSDSPSLDRGSITSFDSNSSPQHHHHHVTLTGPVTDL